MFACRNKVAHVQPLPLNEAYSWLCSTYLFTYNVYNLGSWTSTIILIRNSQLNTTSNFNHFTDARLCAWLSPLDAYKQIH